VANALPPSFFKLAAGEVPHYPPLEGSRRADVCVVGGGFTGLSAALHLAEAGADVVLIDPQFAPKVIAKRDAERMVALISSTAKRENVDLFRRFEVMRHWRDVGRLTFEAFISPDGLHMNDWSYACMAKGLGNGIAEAAQRAMMSAAATR